MIVTVGKTEKTVEIIFFCSTKSYFLNTIVVNSPQPIIRVIKAKVLGSSIINFD